jgi:hypothetical protein
MDVLEQYRMATEPQIIEGFERPSGIMTSIEFEIEGNAAVQAIESLLETLAYLNLGAMNTWTSKITLVDSRFTKGDCRGSIELCVAT